MIKVFDCHNYREFLDKRLKEMPKKGYGKMSELSRFMGVHTTLVSQVLKGHKDLTTDQAILSSEFFGLNIFETEYFLLMVSMERAGVESSKNFYKQKLESMKTESRSIEKRVHSTKKLSEEQRAVFYSDWAYSAVRQSLALPSIESIEEIAKYLSLTNEKVKRCLDFLIQTGLCKVSGKRIIAGPSSTHVEASSPWVRVHHTNWRNKAIESLDSVASNEIHYTLPLTISKKDSEKIRKYIINYIEEVRKTVDSSPSEEFFCLNIDWFKLTKN